MKAYFPILTVILATVTMLPSYAGESSKPLVIESQGSFFVGGESKTSKELSANTAGPGAGDVGDVTINQMYVQYQKPVNGGSARAGGDGAWLLPEQQDLGNNSRRPHGLERIFRAQGPLRCTWRTKPRVRAPVSTPLRSTAVKMGKVPPSELPNVFMASHQTSWLLFRFGPTFDTAFPDEQFPVQAVDELYKQMIPDLNGCCPTPNPTWTNMAALAVQLKGAILIGHSESGFFPEQAALIDPSGVNGMVSIEMPCATKLKPDQLSTR